MNENNSGNSNVTFTAVLFGAAAIAAIWWVFKSTEKPKNNLDGIKKPTGTVTSKEKAIEIANNWHGGQQSPLYSFVSSGQYHNDRYRDYVGEVENNLASANATQKAQLKKLKKWFDYKHWELSK